MNKLQIILSGIVKNNPTFVLVLGMCPTLGTTTSAANGMGGAVLVHYCILPNRNVFKERIKIYLLKYVRAQVRGRNLPRYCQ